MADDFFLDNSQFRRVTNDLHSTGSDLVANSDSLVSELDSYVGCWGSDDIGKGFEENYWVNAQALLTGLEGAGDGVIETADYAQQSADNLESVDEETARWLDSQTETE
jgi:hypothetical protein